MTFLRFSLIIFIISLTGCAIYDIPPKVIRESFSYTNLEQQKISGVYIPSKETASPVFFIFFEDNTFVATFREVWREFLEAEDHDNSTYYFYRYNSWGYYSIKEDSSIVLQEISHRPYGNGYWTFFELKFIMDSLRFSGVSQNQIYPKIATNSVEIESDSTTNSNQKVYDLVFYDSCNCKSSDTWLKYEKWFWKNEQDYLNWIEKSGGDKRKYHK